MKLLYVDACPRGEGVSRTLVLARAFQKAFAQAVPRAEITTYALDDLALAPLTGKTLAAREALIDARAWDHPIFRPARDFASADAVLVAAPYWDLMFPAALKVYIEHIFVRELTFCYRDDAPLGLCRAKRALYLTTAGSPIDPHDFGTSYLRATFAMLGIPRFDAVRAEGLDLRGADVPAILDWAVSKARSIAQTFGPPRQSKGGPYA